MVPYHQLTPDAQRDHLIRAEQLIKEFIDWQLVAKALMKGGAVKGAPIG